MNESITIIALDAMGGDYGPEATVPAALQAAHQRDIAVALIGDEALIAEKLSQIGAENHPLISVVASDGVVDEIDNPALAYRSKPRASIFVAAGMVKMGKAHGFVSMGSTGASIAAATVTFGTMDGIARGTLGGPIIGYAPNCIIIDLGANIDIRPAQLADFGALGSVMARILYDQQTPRIALLNVGSEETKGNELVKQTAAILRESKLNFIGMIEANELPQAKAEVVICDGFIGNIVLKLTEGIGSVISEHVRQATGNDSVADDIFRHTNTLATFGGGPLLGVNGTAIVGHGMTDANGIANAIRTAQTTHLRGFVAAQQDELQVLHAV